MIRSLTGLGLLPFPRGPPEAEDLVSEALRRDFRGLLGLIGQQYIGLRVFVAWAVSENLIHLGCVSTP